MVDVAAAVAAVVTEAKVPGTGEDAAGVSQATPEVVAAAVEAAATTTEETVILEATLEVILRPTGEVGDEAAAALEVDGTTQGMNPGAEASAEAGGGGASTAAVTAVVVGVGGVVAVSTVVVAAAAAAVTGDRAVGAVGEAAMPTAATAVTEEAEAEVEAGAVGGGEDAAVAEGRA